MGDLVHIDEAYVKCPYCNYVQDECYPEPNGDYGVEECGKCEKKFKALAEILYRTKKSCEANDLTCDFKLDKEMDWLCDSKYNHFKCSNCEVTKLEKKVT